MINDEFDSEAASIDMVTLNFLWAEGKFGAMNRDIYDSYKHKRNELWEVVKDLQVNEWGSTNYCCFLLLQTVNKVFSVVSVSCSTDMSTIFPTSFNNKHWVKPWWECGEGRISETIAIIPDWCLTVSRRLLVWAVIMWWPGVRGWRRVSQWEVSVSSGTRDPRHHHHCMTKQAPASFSLFQPAPACSSIVMCKVDVKIYLS